MNQVLPGDNELIVVDNGSSDDPEAAAAQWRGRKRFIPQKENIGFGGACNIGVREARHEAVVLLNPDTELVSDLEQLGEAAVREGSLLGPRILNPDRTLQPSASGPPVGVWPWLRAVIPGPLTPPPLSPGLAPWRRESPTRVAWLTGACIAGKRSQLLALGPFDPGIHLYSEDLDLCLRARREGIESWFRPDLARVVHHGDASTALRFEDRGWAEAARNQRAVLQRTYGPRAERRAWYADRLRMRLNVSARTILRRDSAHERRILKALRSARPPGEAVN